MSTPMGDEQHIWLYVLVGTGNRMKHVQITEAGLNRNIPLNDFDVLPPKQTDRMNRGEDGFLINSTGTVSYRYVLICRDPANKTWLYSGPSQHPKGLPLSSETYIHKIVADALCRFGCPLSTEASLLLSTDFTKSAPQCQITLLFVELNAIGWGASCTMDLIQMNCIDMT